MIVNGQEIWNGEGESNHKISEELLSEVELWLRENLILQKKMNYDHTSYGLKHIVERDIKKYVSNVDFKIVMARLGIKGKLKKKQSWNYSYPIHEHFFHYFDYKHHEDSYSQHEPLKNRRIKRYLELRENPEYRVPN